MTKNKGILLTDNMELAVSVVREKGLIVSGLQVGDVTQQNQQIIIDASKGDIKEDPLMGVGAQLYVEGDDKNGFAREIRSQLQRDGQKISHLSIGTNNIQIRASYED